VSFARRVGHIDLVQPSRRNGASTYATKSADHLLTLALNYSGLTALPPSDSFYLFPMNPYDDLYANTEVPSFFWRSSSYQTIFSVAAVSRFFLFAFNKTEVHGLPRFLNLLQSRSDYHNRRRGLVTVSNHVSVLDDPLVWGVLPLSFAAFHGYMNHRWTFGSHDICFTSTFRSHFFSLGQVLPTHRLAHSQHGGIAQPTLTEGVRLLSKIYPRKTSWNPHIKRGLDRPADFRTSWPHDCVDPFSDVNPAPAYPSCLNDERYYLAPSRYASNSFSWIHIFPEGMIHQSPEKNMRYFKWGVARLILEPPECPDVVPMFIEGTDRIMHEGRQFPRFIPRIGKKVHVTFGKEISTEEVFGDLRKRWKEIRDEDYRKTLKCPNAQYPDEAVGLLTDPLLEGEEAIELRKECTRRLRQEVLKVRRSRGYPDEDPKAGLVETYMREGSKREGRMKDDTWVKDL
jgi:monolysocardiolipin acyltransferase